MSLSKEELKSIREQLMKQIDSMPEPQKSQLRSQISPMNDEELEEFLIQNKMLGEREGKEGGEGKTGQECVFCSILQGKIPSYKIDENKTSIAILEINPLSPGHSIIISKKHSNLSSSAFSLASKIAKRIKRKLKAQEVKIENATIFGHQIINIIPIYKDKKLEKTKAEERELVLLQEKLKTKPRIRKKKQVSEIPVSNLPKAPRRIP